MQSASKQVEKLSVAFTRMVLAADDKLQVGDVSLALRTALNMAFIGTSEAALAVKFVEEHVPFGLPLSDTARVNIERIIKRLEEQRFPVLARERLSDDLGL